MKSSHPRPADRCPFVLRHSISQVTSFMQLGMLCSNFIKSTMIPCAVETLIFRKNRIDIMAAASIVHCAISSHDIIFMGYKSCLKRGRIKSIWPFAVIRIAGKCEYTIYIYNIYICFLSNIQQAGQGLTLSKAGGRLCHLAIHTSNIICMTNCTNCALSIQPEIFFGVTCIMWLLYRTHLNVLCVTFAGKHLWLRIHRSDRILSIILSRVYTWNLAQMFIKLSVLYQSNNYTHMMHTGVVTWKRFSHYWPFVEGIHRPPMVSMTKGQ